MVIYLNKLNETNEFHWKVSTFSLKRFVLIFPEHLEELDKHV